MKQLNRLVRILSVRLSVQLLALAGAAALVCGSACAQTDAALTAAVQQIAAQHHGKVAVYAENLKTGATVAIDADKPVQTASTIKLAILYEALEQIRAGKLRFDDKITMQASDVVSGSGVLLFFDAPLTLTFKDVLTMMIVMSDNTGANLAMDHVGINNVNARLEKLGLVNTHLYKKVMKPVDAGVVLPADYKQFGLGKTTAHEMARLMERFVNCELGEPGAPARASDVPLCEAALHMLHVQFYRNTIPHYLDTMPGATGDSIASKTGSLNAVRNDVAAISTRHGVVVLTVFTYENADHTWGPEQEGELTIAKIARAVVQAWSPDGLAAWPAVTVAAK